MEGYFLGVADMSKRELAEFAETHKPEVDKVVRSVTKQDKDNVLELCMTCGTWLDNFVKDSLGLPLEEFLDNLNSVNPCTSDVCQQVKSHVRAIVLEDLVRNLRAAGHECELKC